MTPKEKARELVNKFYSVTEENNVFAMKKYAAKRCALICIAQILETLNENEWATQGLDREHAWWDVVETEINNL